MCEVGNRTFLLFKELFLYLVQLSNEMVSLEDTAISLHILQPPTATGGGGGVVVKTQSAKICLNLNFRLGGGGCSVLVKTQSAEISLNLNFSQA